MGSNNTKISIKFYTSHLKRIFRCGALCNHIIFQYTAQSVDCTDRLEEFSMLYAYHTRDIVIHFFTTSLICTVQPDKITLRMF